MTPTIFLTQAMTDPALFGQTFSADSFWTWRTVAKLIDGSPLDEPREVALFEQCTGRTYDRQARRAVRRLILLGGRRTGKDRFLSAVGVWRAALCTNWRQHLSTGEQAVVLLLGKDRRQATILRKYCEGLLESPLLERGVARTTSDTIEFHNGSRLEIATNDAGLVRGRTAIALLGSECCHWKTDTYAASNDEEVVAAAEPSMALCLDGGLLLLGSSVGRRAGYMYRRFKELHGSTTSDDVCWLAPSTVMNPLLPQQVVDKALAADPERGGAEYLSRWRSDLSDFLPGDTVLDATDWGCRERAPLPNTRYAAFCDAAGGTGQDCFALCIAHAESDVVLLDAARLYQPRFIPSNVIADLAVLLRSFGIRKVYGDKYAIGFHVDEWRRQGFIYAPSDKSTSENYLTALPLLLAGRARLLDDKVLREQLANLVRRASSSGRESVSHPDAASAHDDLAAAACGALVAAERASRIGIRFGSCGYGGGAITWQPAGSRQGDRDRPRARPLVRVVRLSENEAPATRGSTGFRYQ